jgi:hypothetical protein
LQAEFRSQMAWLKQKYALLHTKEMIDDWAATATVSRRSV